ncbi:CHAD domain-containing protein [Thermus sp.]|uniref:CHAD domain-containing protein n=1 Tax=Thermus sp. TaxID=275 RepID=UPI00307E2D74
MREEALVLLQSPRLGALLQALWILPPLEARQAVGRLGRLEVRAEQALKACQQDPTPEALHALRRVLRRLRYAHEHLGKGTKGLKAIQEVLGAFQDLPVALAYLEAFEREVKPLPRHRQALQARREEAWAEVRRALLDKALTSVP